MLYSSIPRIITIFAAVALYVVACIAIFRKGKKQKKSFMTDKDQSLKTESLIDYEGPERRVYPRMDLDVDISYRLQGKVTGLNVYKIGKTIDISEGGLGVLLETTEKLEKNDRLELKMKLPVFSQYILAQGIVAWSDEIERERLYRCGITFIEIDSNDKKTIAKFVDDNNVHKPTETK